MSDFTDEQLTALEKIDSEAQAHGWEVKLEPGSITALTSALRSVRAELDGLRVKLVKADLALYDAMGELEKARADTLAEREACAKVCDQAEERIRANKLYPAYGLEAFAMAAKEIAATIRARTEAK